MKKSFYKVFTSQFCNGFLSRIDGYSKIDGVLNKIESLFYLLTVKSKVILSVTPNLLNVDEVHDGVSADENHPILNHSNFQLYGVLVSNHDF